MTFIVFEYLSEVRRKLGKKRFSANRWSDASQLSPRNKRLFCLIRFADRKSVEEWNDAYWNLAEERRWDSVRVLTKEWKTKLFIRVCFAMKWQSIPSFTKSQKQLLSLHQNISEHLWKEKNQRNRTSSLRATKRKEQETIKQHKGVSALPGHFALVCQRFSDCNHMQRGN